MSTPPLPRPLVLRAGPGRNGARHRRRLLLLAVGLVAAVALFAVPALAQTGAVGGVVLHGSDETPVGDVEVALVTSDAGEPTILAETRSADDGTFAFDAAAAPRDTEVEVVAAYAGAPYRSGPFVVTADGNDDLEVLVYETTEDASDVRIASWVVWVDREAGVTVQQDLQVENDTGMTWLGQSPDVDGTRAVLTVPLHPGAEALGFLGRFTECCATMRGTSYVHTSPLLPGRTMGTVRYSVETLESLELPLPLPVESFTVMLPPGVELTEAGIGGDAGRGADGPELTEAGQIESRGTMYTVYGAGELEAGDVVALGFGGLDDGSTPAWWYALSAAVGLLVVAGAVWWILRRRRHAAPASAPLEDTGGPDAGRPAVETSSSDHGHGTAPLPAELLVEELALLDLAVDRGYVTREAYEQLREARLAELLAHTSTTGAGR
jgi:hypothetical protein